MKKRQLIALFLLNGAPYVVGTSVLPVFPIHLIKLGADESIIGLYLAMVFAGLAGGTLLSGWISNHFDKRKEPAILGAILTTCGMILMSQAKTPSHLSLSMTLAWVGGGISGGMVITLAGLYADRAYRGRIFGIIGMARGAASIVGGTVGTLVLKHQEFNVLIGVMAGIMALSIIPALLIEDRVKVQARRPVTGEAAPMMEGPFLALLLAGVLVSVAHFSSGLGRPLKMNALDLDSSAIMSTSIVSGLGLLALPFLIGWLSDRIPRKRMLVLSYSGGAIACLVLVLATDLWHFWASVLLLNLSGAGQGVGMALVTDMLPKEALATGLARYTSTPWLGAVIGFASGGAIIKTLDIEIAFLLIAMLPMVAVMLIGKVNPKARIRITQTQTVVPVAGD